MVGVKWRHPNMGMLTKKKMCVSPTMVSEKGVGGQYREGEVKLGLFKFTFIQTKWIVYAYANKVLGIFVHLTLNKIYAVTEI